MISIFFGISALWGLLSVALVGTGSIELNDAQRTYFESLSFADHAISMSIGILNLAGAVSLFLLRRLALPLFITSLSLNLVYAAWSAYATNWLEALGASGSAGGVLGYILLGVVCVYTWHLQRRGVLA